MERKFAILLALFIFFLLMPMAFAIPYTTILWTTAGDWQRGTYINTTNTTGLATLASDTSLTLANATGGGTNYSAPPFAPNGTYLSNTTSVGTLTSLTAVWNSTLGWAKKRNITINSTNTLNLTNHQMLINVTYDSDMRTDYGDLRFTYLNSTGEYSISHWIENYTSTFADVWINVPNISGAYSASNTTVYMYYGNPLATYNNTQGGINTFRFFDNFNRTDITGISGTSLGNGWTCIEANCYITNNVISFETGAVDSWATNPASGENNNIIITHDFRRVDSNYGYYAIFVRATAVAATNNWGNDGYGFYGSTTDVYLTDAGAQKNTTAFATTLNVWYTAEMKINGSDYIEVRTWQKGAAKPVSPTMIWSGTPASPGANIKLSGGGDAGNQSQFDNYFIRKYALITPTFAFKDPEENTKTDYLNTTDIKIELSTDGTTWLSVVNNTAYTSGFGSGSNLRWRANFSTNDTNLTPYLYDLNLTYPADIPTAINLTYPSDNSVNDSLTVNFTFSPLDDYGFINCSIWHNESGTFAVNNTNITPILNNSLNVIPVTFSKQDTQILWGVRCFDTGMSANFSNSNRTFLIKIPFYELNTTDSTNKTRSFFSINEVVNIKANISTKAIPNISVYYPNGSLDSSQLTTNDSSLFFFQYTPKTIGWHRAGIVGRDKYFYVGNNWTNWNDGNRTYPFRVEINITNSDYKYLYPVDLFIDFNYTAYNNSLKLTQFNGTEDFEIPYQLYNITYSGNSIDSANTVFIFSGEGNTTYRLYYYTTDIGIKTYTTDLNLTNQTTSYSIANDYFTAKFDKTYGGALSELYLKKGSNANISGYYPMQYSPRILKGETTIYSGAQTNPTISVETGPVFTQFRATASMGVYSIDYDLKYKFYSYSNTFIVETNTSSRETATWDTFSQYKIYFSNTFGNLSINSSVSPIQTSVNQGDLRHIGLFNNNTYDAIADLFLSNRSNRVTAPDIDFTAGGTNNYYTKTFLSEPVSITTGDWFYSKTGKIFFNNYNPNELNTIYGSFNSTYSYSLKTESTDDQPPVYVLVNYTPESPNDNQNITCYSNWTDNLIINYVIISENSTGSFADHTITLNNQTGWANYTIPNTSIEAGVIFCNFTAYDVGLSTNNTNVTITALDATPPYIRNVTHAPTSAADLDPNVMVNVTANITEYNSTDMVLLQYRMTNETSWTNRTMFNITPIARSTLYKGNFTPLEANYSYRVFANDTLGNTNVSDFTNISVAIDWTWDRDPADFGTVSGALGGNISTGNLWINNTGDSLIRFRVSHNLGRNIYLNDSLLSTGDYLYFNLAANNKTFYSINATAASNERSDSMTITIAALNSSAIPSNNTTTATLVTYSSGPYLLVTITDYNLSLKLGETGTFKAKIQNKGNESATSTYLAWTLPSDWSVATGTQNTLIGTLAVDGIGWNNITATVGASASTGTKTLTANATCTEGKTGTDSETMVVTTTTGTYCGDGTCQSGESTSSCPSDCPAAVTTTGGAGGGAGGISSVGAAALAKVFQTEERFELVRGKDKTFLITIENPFKDAVLSNVSISVSGFLSKYIRLEQENIQSIGKGKSVNISIAIEAPAYFTKGSHNLTFTIEGKALKQEGNLSFVTEVKQTKALFLDIHDVGKSEAADFLNVSLLALDQLISKGFYTKDVEELLEKAKVALNNHDYESVKSIDQEIATIKENAFSSDSAIADLEKKLKEVKDQGITAEQTSRMLSLAKIAFSRGDYATALLRAKEAQLMFAAETKGEFNLLVFLIKNWLQVLIGCFLVAIALLLIYLRLFLLVVNRRLSLLSKEEGILLGLMKTTQKECFEDKKLSMEEYGEAMYQYEARLSKLVQEMIKLETLRSSVLHFIQEKKRLLRERERLLEIIKKTQRDFMERGKYETRIYENKLKSYSARFGEIEERIAFLEAGHALRLKTGRLRLFWQLLDRLQKLKGKVPKLKTEKIRIKKIKKPRKKP